MPDRCRRRAGGGRRPGCRRAGGRTPPSPRRRGGRAAPAPPRPPPPGSEQARPGGGAQRQQQEGQNRQADGQAPGGQLPDKVTTHLDLLPHLPADTESCPAWCTATVLAGGGASAPASTAHAPVMLTAASAASRGAGTPGARRTSMTCRSGRRSARRARSGPPPRTASRVPAGSWPKALVRIGVAVRSGLMQLTRTPSSAHSSASAWVRLTVGGLGRGVEAVAGPAAGVGAGGVEQQLALGLRRYGSAAGDR